MTTPAKSQQLAPQEAPQLPTAAGETAAILSMIERAARDPSVDIEKLERLMQMQERIGAGRARAAFAAALAELQTELPVIQERGRGDKNTKYALWEDVLAAIRPAMGRHGFSLSFRIATPANGRHAITGVLTHREGHSEETTMELPIDTSGSKNAVQAVGSSTSYGKRYVAMAMLNLASSDKAQDDDGRAAGAGATITDAQAEQLRRLIEDTRSDVGLFLEWIGAESVADIPAARFTTALSNLQKKAAR